MTLKEAPASERPRDRKCYSPVRPASHRGDHAPDKPPTSTSSSCLLLFPRTLGLLGATHAKRSDHFKAVTPAPTHPQPALPRLHYQTFEGCPSSVTRRHCLLSASAWERSLAASGPKHHSHQLGEVPECVTEEAPVDAWLWDRAVVC